MPPVSQLKSLLENLIVSHDPLDKILNLTVGPAQAKLT